MSPDGAGSVEGRGVSFFAVGGGRTLAVRGLLLLTVLALVGAAILVLPDGRGAGLGRAGEVLALVVYGGSALLCLLRGSLVRADRLAWLVLGGGLLSYAGASAYLQVPPGPVTWDGNVVLAEAGRFAIYLSAYLAGALLLRTQVRFLAALWLDGILGALAAAGLAAAFLSARGLSGADLGVDSVVVRLVYLTADLLLLALLVALLPFFRWRPQQMWWFFGAGLVLFAAADFTALATLADRGGGLREAAVLLHPAAALLLGVAAWRPVRDVVPATLGGWSVYLVPGLFTLSAVGLLLYAAVHPLPLTVPLLATATLLTAIGRAGMTVAEVRALSDARRQALTDELTGLANRRHFYARLGELLSPGARSTNLAVAVIDLDRFKEVNDSYGHRVGDELLRGMGVRLSRTLPHDALLARLGGDEFALILPRAHERDAVAAAQRLLAELQGPFDLTVASGHAVALHVQASVGVALYPAPGASVDSLLQRADIAMYQAKRARCRVSVYRDNMDQEVRRQLETAEALRVALVAPDQLVLHYQPQVCLVTGRVVGLEALLRWHHPQRGLLFPEEFLPLAERTGVMSAVTRHVLRGALREYAGWYRAGTDALLSVNVSASDVWGGHLVQDVRAGLEHAGVPAERLVLEITESVLLHDFGAARQVLAQLRSLGVQVAIDDYGTGYSSLSYLRTLSVDQLKLDQSFLADLATNDRSAAIVRSTIQLAHSLGVTLVAEGVEDQQACRQLAEWGCDLGQGYFFGGALSPNLIPASLTQRPFSTGHVVGVRAS